MIVLQESNSTQPSALSYMKIKKTLFHKKAVIVLKVEASSNPRSLFETLRSITKKRSIIGDNNKSVNANVILEKLEKLDRWNNYFNTLLNEDAPL